MPPGPFVLFGTQTPPVPAPARGSPFSPLKILRGESEGGIESAGRFLLLDGNPLSRCLGRGICCPLPLRPPPGSVRSPARGAYGGPLGARRSVRRLVAPGLRCSCASCGLRVHSSARLSTGFAVQGDCSYQIIKLRSETSPGSYADPPGFFAA